MSTGGVSLLMIIQQAMLLVNWAPSQHDLKVVDLGFKQFKQTRFIQSSCYAILKASQIFPFVNISICKWELLSYFDKLTSHLRIIPSK